MSLTGKYDCVIYQEQLGLPLRKYGVLELKEQNGKLSGKMFPRYFWLESPFRGGTCSGDEFEFDVYFATPCQQYAMHVKGSVKGDQLEGELQDPTGTAKLIGKRMIE